MMKDGMNLPRYEPGNTIAQQLCEIKTKVNSSNLEISDEFKNKASSHIYYDEPIVYNAIPTQIQEVDEYKTYPATCTQNSKPSQSKPYKRPENISKSKN